MKEINLDFWKSTPYPTLEITTTIPLKGCVVDCVFCPQRVLVERYKGNKKLSFENYKKIIDKIPTEVRITFAGFTEPWLHKECTNMLLYAYDKGHEISAFTTGIGMKISDLERIKHIPFAGFPNGGFVFHLPDNELLAKHPITNQYIELVEYLGSIRNELSNFSLMTMGTVHESIAHVFSDINIDSSDMWSRAGNLTREAILKPELLNLQNKYKSIYHGEVKMTCNCHERLYHNVLLPNGDVSLCCMDYGLEQILGNLFTQEYRDIVPKPFSCFKLCQFCENGVKPDSPHFEDEKNSFLI
jgi:hypothetical protein